MTQLFAQGAERLAGLATRLFCWTPDAFWSATPAEMMTILAPESTATDAPLSRGEFEQMMERDEHG